jgi:hypothetical protein
MDKIMLLLVAVIDITHHTQIVGDYPTGGAAS